MTTHGGRVLGPWPKGREKDRFSDRKYGHARTVATDQSRQATASRDRREASQPAQVPMEASGRPTITGSTFIGALRIASRACARVSTVDNNSSLKRGTARVRTDFDPSERDLRPGGRDDGAGGRLRDHAGSAGIQPLRRRGGRSGATASRAERNGRANAPRSMSALRPEEMWGRPEGSSRRHPCKARAEGSASPARVRNRSAILHSRGGGGYLARTGRLRDCTGRNDRR
jgi:hypothetical protein